MAQRLRVADLNLRAMAESVPRPEVPPEWSPATVAALAELNLREREFVEHYGVIGNAAEAYRRISGRVRQDRQSDTSRILGHQMRSRPRVARAIELVMKDMNFAAAMDREWMLQRLHVAIDRAEEFDSLAALRVIGKLVDRVAKLKGAYLPERQEIEVAPGLTPAAKRFFDALEMAKQRARITEKAKPSPQTIDQ